MFCSNDQSVSTSPLPRSIVKDVPGLFCVLRPTGVEWFRSRDQWQDRNIIPAPGTIIYFDWGGDGIADHVGIVESCDGSTVYTIEGNANDACKQLSYAVGDRRILGYGTLSK